MKAVCSFFGPLGSLDLTGFTCCEVTEARSLKNGTLKTKRRKIYEKLSRTDKVIAMKAVCSFFGPLCI